MISWRIGSAVNGLALLASVAIVALGARSQAGPPGISPAQDATDGEIAGPRPAPVDAFHPDRERAATPAFGGTVTIHLESLPKSLNNLLENRSTTRNMLQELHAYLVHQDWETWEVQPELAARLLLDVRLGGDCRRACQANDERQQAGRPQGAARYHRMTSVRVSPATTDTRDERLVPSGHRSCSS